MGAQTFDSEKQANYLGNDEADESHQDLSLSLLREIDVYNTTAFKGDDSDGTIVWSVKSIFAAFFLAALYTGAQLILYFIGGSTTYIAKDLGITHGNVWLPTANTLAIAATCPWAGYLQDLFGKRFIALFGSLCICVGCALTGSAQSFAQVVAGMTVAGVGAAAGELTGLAGLAEIVPVKHRGYSLAILTAIALPVCPYVIYVEMWSTHDTNIGWRWGPWVALMFNGIVGIGLLLTYFPQARNRANGFSRRAILARIDYVGGVLSITGLTLLLVALNSGGYTHEWRSAYVVCTLIIGLALIVAWVVWEWKFAKCPMVPGALFKGQRIVALAYFVAFAAGLNFYSVLNLFPITFTNVYEPDPVKIGLRSMAPTISIAIGAVVFNSALSRFPGHTREILFIAVLLMTIFAGALAVMTPENEKAVIGIGSIASFGIGGVLVPAATLAMIVCPDALITTAAALSLSIRTIGGSIGYAIYYNIFTTKLEQNLPAYIAEYAVKAGLPATSAQSFVGLYLTDPEKLVTTNIEGVTEAVIAGAAKGSQWAYSQSLKYVWFTTIAFGSIAIICVVLIPSTRKYQTNRVAVKI